MAQAIQTPEQVSTATGVENTFATVWTFEAAAEVRVIVEVAGVQTVQVQGVDYDVAAGTWLTDGANCVFRAGRLPPNGARVIRQRVTPAQQVEPFGDNEKFRPLQSEKAYDRLTRQVQEERAKTARAVTLPFGEPGLTLPRVAARADGVAIFDDAGEFDVIPSSPGEFLGWDADGAPVALTGTGADDGLRVDLAAGAVFHARLLIRA